MYIVKDRIYGAYKLANHDFIRRQLQCSCLINTGIPSSSANIQHHFQRHNIHTCLPSPANAQHQYNFYTGIPSSSANIQHQFQQHNFHSVFSAKIQHDLQQPKIIHTVLPSSAKCHQPQRRTFHTSVTTSLAASTVSCKQSKVDKSLYPELLEKDLVEKAIKGWGPGGQSVNKTSSACFLKHIPTGLYVKVHEHRALQQNRKSARAILRDKLDQHLNGDRSVAAQQDRFTADKTSKRHAKSRKKQLMKEHWIQSRQQEDGTLRQQEDGTLIEQEDGTLRQQEDDLVQSEKEPFENSVVLDDKFNITPRKQESSTRTVDSLDDNHESSKFSNTDNESTANKIPHNIPKPN